MNKVVQDFKFFFINGIIILIGFFNLMYQEIEFPHLLAYTIVLITFLFLVKLVLLKIFLIENRIFDIIGLLISIGWMFLVMLNPYLAPRQLVWICSGLILMVLTIFIAQKIPRELIQKNKYLWLIITLTLLFLPFIMGVEVKGARIWLEVGNFRFQTSELAKIFYLVFLTSFIREKALIKKENYILAWLAMLSCVSILVLQKDLGMALVFYLTFFLILFLTTRKITSQVVGIFILCVGALVAFKYFPHVHYRFLTWLSPWEHPQTSGYQMILSLFSFSNGGILGVGLGSGFAKLIPEVHTDFIFAAIAEQLGIIGSISIILLFLLFLFFSYHEIKFIPTKGSRILAFGLSAIMVIEALIIIAGVSKLIPLTGLPLPFMGYGGSAIITNFISLGLILALISQKSLAIQVKENDLKYVFNLILIVTLALLVNLTYWQVLKVDSMRDNPLNPRFSEVKLVESTNIPTSLHKVLERNGV